MLATRRIFTQRMIAAMCADSDDLLSRLPAPSMLSAGVIARNGRGRVAMRAVSGRALHPGGAWGAFADDQPFRVASVSKMITASLFMRLAVRSDIDLDADISEHLGARVRHPAFLDHPISARMLLSHTSGLRNGGDFPVPFNRSLLARLNEAATEEQYGGWFAPPSEPPGSFFRYSDTNFALIAQVLECITGIRFDKLMRRAVFAPLGLDAGYNWSGVSQAKRDRTAAAFRWLDETWTAQVDADPPRAPEIAFYRGEHGGETTEGDFRLCTNGFAFAPHGGLRLSLRDMDRLAREFARGGGALTLMAAPAWRYDGSAANGDAENGFYQAYGLGMQTPLGIEGADAYFGADTRNWRGHCGDAYGWMTGLWWNTRTRASIVYAINGMPESDRPRGARSALTAHEEALIDLALAALG
jgi:CubicO group peptidase (beta-lactamase class C family)